MVTALLFFAHAVANFQTSFNTIELPWRDTMSPGKGYDLRVGKARGGGEIVKADTTITDWGDQSSVEYNISYSTENVTTKRLDRITLSAAYDSLTFSANLDASFGELKQRQASSGAFAISYYVETPKLEYSLPYDANLSIPAITAFSKIKADYVKAMKAGSMGPFYDVWGTHLITGWRKVYGVAIGAKADNDIENNSLRLDVHAGAHYDVFDASFSFEHLDELRRQQAHFNFQFNTKGLFTFNLPELPTTVDEMTSKTYLSTANQYLSGLLKQDEQANGDKPTIGLKSSQESYSRGTRVVAYAVPWSEMFKVAASKNVESFTPREMRLFGEYGRLEALADAYFHLSRNGNDLVNVISPTDRAAIPTNFQMVDKQANEVSRWLRVLRQMPRKTFADQDAYDRKSLYIIDQLNKLPLISGPAIPKLTFARRGYAWADTQGIHCSLRVPKNKFGEQFYVVGYDKDGSEQLRRQICALPNPPDPQLEWYIDMEYKDQADTGADRKITFRLVTHGPGDLSGYYGRYKVNLETANGFVLSTLYIPFKGQTT